MKYWKMLDEYDVYIFTKYIILNTYQGVLSIFLLYTNQ